MYPDTPRIKFGEQNDAYKSIYHKGPEGALIVDVSLCGGYGVIPAGTLLSRVVGTGSSKGKYIPYGPTTVSSAAPAQQGRAFLVEDAASGTDLYVTIKDSYKFQVGDYVYVYDNNTKTSSATDCGAITAIDRTSNLTRATISVTNTVAASTFTVAQSACISLVAGADNSNTYFDAAGILDVSVDTGEEDRADGGLGSMVISNAILYKGMLANYDTAGGVDLSASTLGNFVILK